LSAKVGQVKLFYHENQLDAGATILKLTSLKMLTLIAGIERMCSFSPFDPRSLPDIMCVDTQQSTIVFGFRHFPLAYPQRQGRGAYVYNFII
jgi:hypothetical protein